MSDWGFPRYVSVAEKKAKAAKKLQQLLKKRPDIRPVVVEGNVLARTWWGKAWNKNLERYADYSNRLGRGKSYLRHGAVLDLKIDAGTVRSLVQGTGSSPYEIVIRIQPIQKKDWQVISKQCQGELQSLPDLLAGNFSKGMGDILLAEGKGLFPTPRAISFDCSCPDWASMCKHVAATLYGIGARLDQDPLLFFTLRQVDIDDFVGRVVQDKAGELLAKTAQKSARILNDADLSGLFGIDMETQPDFGVKPEKSTTRKATAGKIKKAAEVIPGPPKSPAKRQSAMLQVEEIILASDKNITVAMLAKATGFALTKIYATTSRLRQQGRISYVAQGVYGRP